MSLSTSGALKAALEGDSAWKPTDVGVPVFRDRVPAGQPLPYITVSEALSVVPYKQGSNGKGVAAQEMVQVDVWQQWVDLNTDRTVERYTLAGDVARTLHGSTLTTAPQTVYGMHVTNRIRLPDDDTNVVHDAITVQIERKL